MNLKNNPELIPLIDWWEKEGKQFLIYLAVGAAIVGGYYGVKNHRAAVRNASSAAVMNAYTTEELEEAVSKFDGTAADGVLRIRLAKSYYDAGRYQDALAIYEALSAKQVDGFDAIPAVGKAQCLEALGNFDAAGKAFDAFAEANPTNYLKLTAQLGGARCLVEGGNAKGALARIEALKVAYKDDDVAKARIESTEDVIKRFGQKASEPVVKTEEPKAEPKVEAKTEAKVEEKPAK